MNVEHYAVKASGEIREISASGGAFYILGEYFIEKLHGNVCGILWEKGAFRYKITDCTDGLRKMLEYPYVWGDIEEVLVEISKLLAAGKYVLFGGTPCQIAQIKEKDIASKKKFYLLDYTCEGVLKREVFKDYIDSFFHERDIASVSFRNKEIYRWSYALDIKLIDGKRFTEPMGTNSLLQLWDKGLGLCDACSKGCVYNVANRLSDLTIGDFWWAGELDKKEGTNLSDSSGVSLLSVNTEKGRDFISACEGSFQTMEKLNAEAPFYFTAYRSPKIFSQDMQKDFWYYYEKFGIKKAIEVCIDKKQDVALLGLWNGGNYGAIITAYALGETIQNMGKTVVFIDTMFSYGNRNDKLLEYITGRSKVSKRYKSSGQCYELNDFFETFIVGSDQCWNYSLNSMYDNIFFFGFVDDRKKKISYSTSLGPCTDTNVSEIKKRKRLIQRFDALSVRESSSIKLIEEMVSKSVFHAIDPILLRDAECYKEEVKDIAIDKQEYVLNYLLDIRPQTMDIVDRINNESNKKQIVTILGLDYTNPWDKKIGHIVAVQSIYEFIAYFIHSQYVVTDSYHGMCLAILFNKPFRVIINNGRGRERFDSALDYFNLKKCAVESASEICTDFQINWNTVNEKLQLYKKQSKKWLEDALNIQKEDLISTEDILRKKIYEQSIEIKRLSKSIENQRSLLLKPHFVSLYKKIYKYYDNNLSDGMLAGIRGGGVHTKILLELILPIIKKKSVRVFILDKNPKDIYIENECFPATIPDSNLIMAMDCVIISAWKYRKEIKKEMAEISNSCGKRMKIMDLYDDLGIDAKYPFYVDTKELV